MDFDDIFENNGRRRREDHHNKDHKHYEHNYTNRHHQKDDNSFPFQDFRHSVYFKSLVERVKNNRKLQGLVVLSVLFVLLVFILFLGPLIGQLIHYVSENGIQGVINYLERF